MRILNKTDLKKIAMGAALLGCGGGGDPYLGRLAAEQMVSGGKTIHIIDIDELSDQDLAVTVAYVGSPAIGVEKIFSPHAVILAIKTLEKHFNISINALIPLEIGGGNSLVPLFTAGELDIPVVNGDGMGRAFPQLEMTTYSIYGDLEPVAAIADDDGYSAIFRADTHADLEKVVRAEVIKRGGNLASAQFPMSKALLEKLAIPNTLSVALALGEFIQNLSLDDQKFERMCDFFNDTLYKRARILFTGKIVDVRRTNNCGYTMGEIDLQNKEESALIKFQNENLFFKNKNQMQAIVPDLIVVLDQQTAEPLQANQYRYGQRVTVLEIGAPPELMTARALAVLRPKPLEIKGSF
jgi:DUF917 family protein